MSTSMRSELLKLAMALAVGAGGGWAMGSAAAGIAAALALYVALQLRRMFSLRAWAEHPRRVELLPYAPGPWGEIASRLSARERHLREREQRLLSMLAEFQASAEALRDGVVVLDQSARIAWFNLSARAMLGLVFPRDVGQRIANLLRAPAFGEYFDGGRYEKEIEIPAPKNEAVALSLRLIPYGNNQLLLIVRDVSEAKRLDRMRRDFVANASHELRTPLTVLRGYLEMIQPEARAGGALAEWQAPLGEMHAQASRMDALIKDLLKLARLEGDAMQGRQDMIDVTEMLERLLAEAQALSQSRHRFESWVEPGLLLYGREVELESVFGNLLENAVQYTPDGGAIRMVWEEGPDGARFSVSDTGIGVAPDDIPRLTERFYRADAARSRAKGGTGLGLAIVKHALERHEASLEIQSRLGEGSTFICHFPQHRIQRRQSTAANG